MKLCSQSNPERLGEIHLMMAPYHYLNKLLVDKFTSGTRRRSGIFMISQATASPNHLVGTRQELHRQQQQRQVESINKENFNPDDELRQLMRPKQQLVLNVDRKLTLDQTGKVEAAEDQSKLQQQQQQPPPHQKRRVLVANDLRSNIITVSNSSSSRIMKRTQGQKYQQHIRPGHHHHWSRPGQYRSANHTFAILDNNMSCPTILHTTALILFVMSSSLSNLQQVDCAATAPQATSPTTANSDGTYLSATPSSPALASPLSTLFSRENSRSPPTTFPPLAPTIDWNRFGTYIQNRLQSLQSPSPSASRIGSGSGASDGTGSRNPTRVPPILRGLNPLVRAVERLSSQMGARNTIRVHNAFRDFAWRILSSLSMPTPVIYELRRQNFYSPEEDTINDSFYNRNTTKTIRSKRLIDPALLSDWLSATAEHLVPATGAKGRSLQATGSKIRRAAGDEDDEPETIRERMRMRLEDLLSLSRRSLFGRVIRLPSLFPFKRQEGEEDGDGDDPSDRSTLGRDGGGGAKSTTGNPGGKQVSPKRQLTSSRLLAASRRRRKEADRQMISINGKQYYVDDDGELKEWKEQP